MKKFLIGVLLLFPFLSNAQEIRFPDVTGWEKTGKTLSFNSDNLFEHIDGAAEFYFGYGFQALQVARWEKGGSELTIEVYDHGDPLRAYGIYSMERPESAQTKPIGLEGYYDETILNFVTGKYYVKMNSYQVENAGVSLLSDIATKFAATLCEKPVAPKVIGAFPTEKLMPNSIQFIPGEFMGLGFLGAATRAKYSLPEGETTLFVIEKESKEAAGAVVAKYFEFTEEKAENLAEGDFKLNDPFNGPILLHWNGKFLVGAAGKADQKTVSPLFAKIVEGLNK